VQRRRPGLARRATWAWYVDGAIGRPCRWARPRSRLWSRIDEADHGFHRRSSSAWAKYAEALRDIVGGAIRLTQMKTGAGRLVEHALSHSHDRVWETLLRKWFWELHGRQNRPGLLARSLCHAWLAQGRGAFPKPDAPRTRSRRSPDMELSSRCRDIRGRRSRPNLPRPRSGGCRDGHSHCFSQTFPKGLEKTKM
jgi:hypothetical protein